MILYVHCFRPDQIKKWVEAKNPYKDVWVTEKLCLNKNFIANLNLN